MHPEFEVLNAGASRADLSRLLRALNVSAGDEEPLLCREVRRFIVCAAIAHDRKVWVAPSLQVVRAWRSAVGKKPTDIYGELYAIHLTFAVSPYIGLELPDALEPYANMQALYREHYGEPPAEYWSTDH